MSETAAKVYLGAIKDSLNSPNMVLDLRIPQNQQYQQVVLDTAVSPVARRARSRSTSRDRDDRDGWNEITNELGRDDQLTAYRATLGVKK